MNNTQLKEQLEKIIPEVEKQIKQAHEAEIYNTGMLTAYKDVLQSLNVEASAVEEPEVVKGKK